MHGATLCVRNPHAQRLLVTYRIPGVVHLASFFYLYSEDEFWPFETTDLLMMCCSSFELFFEGVSRDL